MKKENRQAPLFNGYKDTKYQSETKIFYDYLQAHTATCSMASEATGLKQKNLCRYKVELQKANLLWEVDFKPCKLTGFLAQWLTTNADMIPSIDKAQLSLFSGSEVTYE